MMGVVAGTPYTCLRAFVDCRSNLLCFLLLGTLFGRCIALLLLFFLFCYTIHAIKFYFSGIQNPLKHLRWSFYENSERLQVVNYFSKKLHLSYLTVVLVRLWILLFSYFLVFHVFDSSMTIGSVHLVRQYSVLMFSLQIFKILCQLFCFLRFSKVQLRCYQFQETSLVSISWVMLLSPVLQNFVQKSSVRHHSDSCLKSWLSNC